MAIDPSLTCSGWALFDVRTEKVLAVGKVRSKEPSIPLAERLSDLQIKISKIMHDLSLGTGDCLICEAPTTMRDPRAAIKVEQVRGIFEAVARMREATVPGRINPRSVHHEVLGFGGKQVIRVEVKRAAVEVASRLFQDPLSAIGFDPSHKNLKKHQDIVDALLLGYLGLTKLRSAEWADTSIEQLMHRPDVRSTLRKVAS